MHWILAALIPLVIFAGYFVLQGFELGKKWDAILDFAMPVLALLGGFAGYVQFSHDLNEPLIRLMAALFYGFLMWMAVWYGMKAGTAYHRRRLVRELGAGSST